MNAAGGIVETVLVGWYYWTPIYATYNLSNQVNLNNGTINIGANSTIVTSGSNDAISLAGSDTLTISGSATGDVITASGTGNNATLIGGAVVVNNGASLSLTGTSDAFP